MEIPILIGAQRNTPQGLGKGMAGYRNHRKNREHPDHRLAKSSSSPRDLMELESNFDDIQRNRKRRLYCNKNETITLIINAYSEIAQKESESKHG